MNLHTLCSRSKILAILFFAFTSGGLMAAPVLLTDSAGSGFLTGYLGSYNLGYQFTVGASDLSVSALGFYDAGQDGLAESHQVGLWQTDGTLLATTTIAAGVHALTNGFAFSNLAAAVILEANNDYILSAFWSSNADRVYANFLPEALPSFNGVSLVGARGTGAFTPASSTFSFPSIGATPGAAFIGANLIFEPVPANAVPDSASSGVLALLGVVLVVALRRQLRA